MLTVFVATFVIFALVILGMSLGYLVKRKSIQGSCGISSLGLEKVCICPEPCDARKKRLAREAQRQAAAYFVIFGHFGPEALRLPGLLLRFCRPGQAQPPPGIKTAPCRELRLPGLLLRFVGRVRRQPPPGNNMPAM